MMRVVHVGNYKPDSANGVNVCIAELVRQLPKEGIEVELWHFTPKVTAVGKRQVEDVRVFDLPYYRQRWRNAISMPKETRRFLQLRSQVTHLLHLHSVFLPENLSAARLGVKYVVTPHGGYSPAVLRGRNRMLKQIWILLWERSYLKRAAVLHAVSPSEAAELRNFPGTKPVAFIPNGVDDALLQRECPKAREGSALVFLGRLAVEYKGLDLLVKGYALLREDWGSELAPLTLAGPDFRGGRKHIEQLAQNLGISDSIHFQGPVFGEDKWSLLSQARLFVHTSRKDTMPRAVLEALALGRPSLVTREVGLAPYIEEYSAGWVVEGTSRAIAGGLRAALETPPKDLDVIGDRARALVKDNFSWPHLVRQMTKVYRGVPL